MHYGQVAEDRIPTQTLELVWIIHSNNLRQGWLYETTHKGHVSPIMRNEN